MTHLLIVILDDLSCLPDLLQAWREIDVRTTIMESVGARQAETWLSKAGLANLDRLFDAREVRRRTLWAVIEEDKLLAQAVAEAERVVGGFERPDSGLLLVLPVGQTKGLHKVEQVPVQEELPPAVRPDWIVLRDTPVDEVADILDLKPTVISPDTPLDEVADAMLTHPRVHVACVVAEDGRLVGLLGLREIADDVFFHIMPEEFLGEISDLDEVMEFAEKSAMRTASDAMQDPVWVKRGETVREAFRRMHEHKLPGLPVVDEQYHVVGYINLLELLAIGLKRGGEASAKGQSQ